MIVIGEKINATRPSVGRIIERRDDARLAALAVGQAQTGAAYIDVNVGTGNGTRANEVEAVRWAVDTVQRHVDTPICIDSADPAVIEAGLESVRDRPAMVNSVKAEKHALDSIVPLAAAHGASLIALAMDENGIPDTVEKRLAACNRIARVCGEAGLGPEKLFFDPLVMPISTDIHSGKVTLDTLQSVKRDLPGAKTVTGLSNVSFGLPERSRVNAAFLQMCIFAGLDAVILDPTDAALTAAVTTGEVLVGRDRHCRRYTRKFRRPAPPDILKEAS